MAEETYQDVADKVKENEVGKVEVPEPPPSLERSETVIEENEENETTDELETKPVEKVAIKKKQPACRAKLRDKVTCPKCGKELSRHSYEYTHSKFCKGKPCKASKPAPVGEEEEDEDVKEITKKMEQMTISELIEETKPKPKPEPEPVIIDIEEVPKAKPKFKLKPKPQPSKYQETTPEYVPTDEDIKRYLSNIRKEKAMKKQQGYDRLMINAF